MNSVIVYSCLASYVSASFTFYRTKHVILNRDVRVALIRFSMRETGNSWLFLDMKSCKFNSYILEYSVGLYSFFYRFCCLTHYCISRIWRFFSNFNYILKLCWKTPFRRRIECRYSELNALHWTVYDINTRYPRGQSMLNFLVFIWLH